MTMAAFICPEQRCTGCSACLNSCPRGCIRMTSDDEGFLRPEISGDGCTDCGACRRVCPMLHLPVLDPAAAPQVYACWNIDDSVRFRSASGGVFSAFAQTVLQKGGIVYGAAYDENLYLKHIAVSRSEDLDVLRSSKYVQSDIGRCFGAIRDLLDQGRPVLFSGTPCQVDGLSAFLGREHELLYTCDMLCHGVPSPGLFFKYVEWLQKRFHGKLAGLNMRHKGKGWKKIVSTVALSNNGREQYLKGVADSFMLGFVKEITLRPACYLCPYTNIDRRGDLTLADFWGIGEIAPFHHDTKKGVSLILANSEKGRQLFADSRERIFGEERTLAEARHKRTKLSQPVSRPGIRETFFADYKRLGYEELAKKHLLDRGLKGLIKQMVPGEWIFHLRHLGRKTGGFAGRLGSSRD